MSFLYNTAKRDFANGVHDWDAGGQIVKVLLVTSGYTPDKDHDFVNDVASFEVAGTGYVGGFGGAGRKAIANRTVVADLANDRAELDGDDISWASLNVGAIAGAVIFRERTADSDSELIAFVDSGFPVTSSGTDFLIAWNSEGILQIT
jgi:hypothetical protein